MKSGQCYAEFTGVMFPAIELTDHVLYDIEKDDLFIYPVNCDPCGMEAVFKNLEVFAYIGVL